MASPGLLASGLLATRLSSRAVVGSLACHLGHEAQNYSVNKGYNQNSEDTLLRSVNWENDGYQLFKIASFDPSSRFGFFSVPAETNSLFMTREMWKEIGGYDTQFDGKGGGLVNHDVWKRLCSDTENKVILLLGEATFHQFHGGVATNSTTDIWQLLNEEYKNIRGAYYQFPDVDPIIFGKFNECSRSFIEKQIPRSNTLKFLKSGLRRFLDKIG